MKKIIVDLIKDVLKKQRVEMSEEEIASFIEIPQNYEKGDYAFPCFYLANKLKMSPNEIACELRKDIKDVRDKVRLALDAVKEARRAQKIADTNK